MSVARRVLFRADSGVGIGHGHATRVEALARAAERAGASTRFVVRPLAGRRPPAVDLAAPWWIAGGEHTASVDGDPQRDARETLALCRRHHFVPDVVIVDAYELGPPWHTAMRDAGAFVVALDDHAGRAHAADLIVELLPGTSTGQRLRGLQFLPMDPGLALPQRQLPGRGWRVLVTFGGADPTGHTLLALDAVDAVDAHHDGLIAHVDIVIGAAHPSPYAIRARVDGHPRRRLHVQVPSLIPLFETADLVVTAAGNAMVEAVAAGRVAIAVVTAENQMELAHALGEAGLVHLVPKFDAATATGLARALTYVACEQGARIAHKLSYRPIDAFGADRLIGAVFSRLNERAS